MAGVGLADARIDDATLGVWHDWCAAQDLRCDLVLQSAATHDEVLGLIAQCGRAVMSWSTGKLGVVYEDADTPVSGLITPGNIIAGSFKVDWPPGGISDEIVVRFIDPDNDWQYTSVRRNRPGLTGTPASTTTVTARGITTRDHAAIECNLAAARQHYHRRRLSWEMGHEGRAHVKGDVVRVTHSLIDGGVAGRLVAINGPALTLDREVQVDSDTFIMLRLLDGGVHSSSMMRTAPGTGLTRAVTLTDPPPSSAVTEPQDVLWRLYEANLAPVKLRITGVEPVDDRRFKFTAIDEVAAYHDAGTSDLSVPLPKVRSQTPRIIAATFAERLVRVSAGFAVELEMVLTVAGDWRGGFVTMSIEGAAPTTVATLTNGAIRARWGVPNTGVVTIAVVPGSEVAPVGQPFMRTYAIQGVRFPPGAPENFLIDVLGDGTRRLRWTPPADPDLAGVIVRYYSTSTGTAPDWEDMIQLHRGYLTASPLETVEPAEGNFTFVARAIDTSGILSETDVRIVADVGPQRQGNAVLWRCPSAQGWPGILTNFVRSNDGLDALATLCFGGARLQGSWEFALEGRGNLHWRDIGTWNDWLGWTVGDGNDGLTAATYQTPIEDLGRELVFSLDWSGDTVGDVDFQYRIGSTQAELGTTAWATYTAGTQVTARYVQVRWRLTGPNSQILTLDHLCWSVLAPSAERRLLDVSTAGWRGSSAAGRLVPHDLAVVTDVDLTLQSVGAGWSWSLDSKDPLRIKIFNGDGDPADATVDIIIRGIVG